MFRGRRVLDHEPLDAKRPKPAATFTERNSSRGLGRAARSENTAMSVRLRRIWLWFHRWIGLTAGLLFALLGLTGSALVFDHAIDEWLNPQLLLTEGSGPQRSIEEIIAAAEASYLDGSHKALSVTVPRVENGVWSVWFVAGTEQAPKYVSVHVDPYTAEVTGQRVWGEYFMTWVYRLHYQLMGGELGGTIVGIAGIVMLVSIISGIVLWWPLLKSGLRSALAIRRSKLSFDLHKTLGITTSGLLIVIVFTGIYMEFPRAFHRAARAVSSMSKQPHPKSAPNIEGKPRITADEALELARQRFPNAKFDHLHPPEGERGTYEVAFRQPNEVQQSYGRTQVFLDQYTGEVVAVYTPDDFTPADIFFAWQFPLHNGEAFGLAGRWVVFVLGVVPTVLYVTGFLLWWRKRQSRKRQLEQRERSERSTSVPPPARRPKPVPAPTLQNVH